MNFLDTKPLSAGGMEVLFALVKDALNRKREAIGALSILEPTPQQLRFNGIPLVMPK